MVFVQRLCAALLMIMALFLIVMGGRLIMLDGSFYYLLIGLVYLVAAVMAWRGDARSVWLIGAGFVATLLWSFYEVGTNYWATFPRLLVPLALFCGALLVFSSTRSQQGRWFMGLGVIALVAVVAFFARGFIAVPITSYEKLADYTLPASDNAPVDWTAYSRDTMGTRYSPFNQINRENVKDLSLAWTYRTGRNTSNPNEVDQNTPLQIGNTLYSCTPTNAVHAINATTGERKWLFDAKAKAYA